MKDYMELGLSLGDSSSSKPDQRRHHHRPRTTINKKANGLSFCVLSDNIQEPTAGNALKFKQNDSDYRISDDGGDRTASEEEEEEEGHFRDLRPGVSLELDLLPLAPVPRHHPFPWSSDNGSSENGSSGNVELQTAARGLDVSRLRKAAATEEVSSSFRMESSIFKCGGSDNKPICEAYGNDAGEAAERASSRASDDDDNNNNAGVNSRKKLRLSKQQSSFLEESFKENHTLNPKQKIALAKQLNLRPRQVEVWFQNRRARTKLKQTEIDCDYLKRCCETLTEENKRLHKELQELRALKTSNINSFYTQLPATTLTMCPSCEKVAATSTITIASISNPTTPKTATVAAVAPNPQLIPKAIPFPGIFPFTASRNYPSTE